jgi:phage protein D
MNEPRVPGFDITGVAGEMANFVKRVTIDYYHDGPDMFAVYFLNQSAEHQTEPTFTHASGKYFGSFKEGAALDVKFGYDSDGKTDMIKGEVSGMEAIFREHDPAMFVVRGFDKLHRLSRGRKQRTFMNMKDSDIASQMAGEMGLSADVDDTGIVHDHVFQNNLSDIDFLYWRARSLGYEVDCDGLKLVFKKPRTSAGPVTLTWQQDVKRARFYLSTTHQVSKVEVRGWDPATKKAILGTASAGADEFASMGSIAGGKATAKGFGEVATVVCGVSLTSQEEADKLAKARLNELSMLFITGECELEGNPAIKAGTVVEFTDFGKKFDGKYYVTRATHDLRPGAGPGKGYSTRFQFKRSHVDA